MCREQWALTVIKLLRFFVLIFAVFLPDFIFLYNSGTVIQVSWKLWMFLISTPRKTRTFTVRLAVTTKYQKQFCSRGVAWTRLPKSRPNQSHRKRSYSISNIGNMMGCDHQSCVPVGPFAGQLWHFEYFPTTTVRQLLIFDHMTVTVVRICCCVPNFIKIGSRVSP